MTQLTQSDVLLAQLSVAAYSDSPSLPQGFSAPALSFAIPGISYHDGVFHSGAGAAFVTTGLVDGAQSLVIAFRASDDRADSLHALRGINAAYDDFVPLVQAVDAYASATGIQHVIATGHSLGAAMAQLYLAGHPDAPGAGMTHAAVTFGSPGVQSPPAPDLRADNIIISDDPAVLLGVHRGEVGPALAANPELAWLAAREAAHDFPGLTLADALASLPYMTANYVNNGPITLLPDAQGQIGIIALDGASPAEHDALVYLDRVTAAVAGTGGSHEVPAIPATPEDTLDRALYAGDYPADGTVQALLEQVVTDWATPHDVTWAMPSVLGTQHDLGLF